MNILSKNKRLLFVALFLIAVVSLTASSCKSPKEKPVAEPSETSAKAEPKADTKEKVDAKAEVKPGEKPGEAKPNVSVYPGFDFGKLAVDHQKLFIEVAKTELCPCPGAKGSLHECLQSADPKVRCSVAMEAAQIIATMANAGMGKTDIYSKVSEYVDLTKKIHTFSLEATPMRGNKDAKVVIVEFADFQCSHCKEAAGIMKQVSEKMGDKIAFYYKNFTLGSPMSVPAATAALAAHQQGKFWPMHDMLFKDQRTMSDEKIQAIGQGLGLNMKKFKDDLKNPSVVAQVNLDRKEGENAGLSGTPTLYINGRLYLGDKSVDAITKAINEILKTETK